MKVLLRCDGSFLSPLENLQKSTVHLLQTTKRVDIWSKWSRCIVVRKQKQFPRHVSQFLLFQFARQVKAAVAPALSDSINLSLVRNRTGNFHRLNGIIIVTCQPNDRWLSKSLFTFFGSFDGNRFFIARPLYWIVGNGIVCVGDIVRALAVYYVKSAHSIIQNKSNVSSYGRLIFFIGSTVFYQCNC